MRGRGGGAGGRRDAETCTAVVRGLGDNVKHAVTSALSIPPSAPDEVVMTPFTSWIDLAPVPARVRTETPVRLLALEWPPLHPRGA